MIWYILAAIGLLPSPRPAMLCLACKRQVASRDYVQRPLNIILGPCKRHLLCSISLSSHSAFKFVLFWNLSTAVCLLPLNLIITGMIESPLRLISDLTNLTFSEILSQKEWLFVFKGNFCFWEFHLFGVFHHFIMLLLEFPRHLMPVFASKAHVLLYSSFEIH